MKVATGKRLSKADFLQWKRCRKSILFPEVYPIIQSVVWYCEFSSIFFVVFCEQFKHVVLSLSVEASACDPLNFKCENGGVCGVVGGSPKCVCPAEYTGDHCEKESGERVTMDL